jgi:hypothetical protein
MGKITPQYNTEQLHLNSKELVAISTGEVINIENSNIFKSTITNKVVIKYSNFVFLDTNQIFILLEKGLKHEELALIVILSSQIEIESNICIQDSQIPHTTASIAKYINCSHQSAKRKLNKLIKIGAMYYGPINRKSKKLYVINPHIIKKGKTTRNDIVAKFNSIYYKSKIQNIIGE